MVARNWYMTDCEWPLFLFKYANPEPVSRRAALELSYECVRFLGEIGPLEARAKVLSPSTTGYSRAGACSSSRGGSVPEVARLWRQSC